MKIINMPSFGADMATGEIAKWNVKEGDKVARGDIIATIETMKGLIDMEVFDEGTINKLLVKQGEEVQVGIPIAELNLIKDSHIITPIITNDALNNTDAEGEEIADAAETAEVPAVAIKTVSLPIDSPTLAAGLKISPAARAKAQQQNIDWQNLKPNSEKDGPILMADILKLAEHSQIQTDSDQVHKPKDGLASMRKAIAAVVSRSKQEVPHYYLQQDICLDQAHRWLSQHNQSAALTDRILINALLYCAIAKALASFTQFNGFYINGEYQARDVVHLGNVINLRKGGLVVAAIHNAHTLSPTQMMDKIKDQVIRAKEGGLRMSEMQDATITVSNMGERGVDSIQSIVFPPQVAIIGVGRVRASPWIVDEKVVSANIATLTLAADHRVSDGHTGARLLNKIDSFLQKPKALI